MGFSLTQTQGLSLMNIVIYLLLFAWMLTAVSKHKIFESNNVNKYLILMVFIIFISSPLRLWRGEFPEVKMVSDLISIKNWFNPFLLFFIVFNIIDEPENCKRTLVGLIVLLVVTASTSPLISLGVVKFGVVKSFYHGRAGGFDDPNVYAAFLVLFIPLLMTYLLSQKGTLVKSVNILFLFVTFLALIITGSRGGAISFVIGIGTYAFLLNRARILEARKIVILLVMVVVIASISYLFAPHQLKKTVNERFNVTEYENVDEFSAGRLMIFRKGLEFFMERPIFGHGYNTFTKLMSKRLGIRANSHNEYLAHLVHYGLIGLGVYIMILSRIFHYVWYCLKTTTDQWSRRLYISYIAGFSGYAVSMLAVNMTSTRYLFWIYTAVIYRYSQLENNKQG